MASSTLAFLLNLPPDQAVVRMLNDANGTNYRLDRFTVSAPRVVAGTTTAVTLTSTDISPYLDDQVTVGSIDFTYERLQLALFLKGVLDNFTPTLPCSTQNLLDEITHRLDQQFYGDDILLEELTRSNGVQYVLKAKPESLRFVGSITLPLIQVVDISTLYSPNLIVGNNDLSPIKPNLDNCVAYVTGTDILNQDTTVVGALTNGGGGSSAVVPGSTILPIIQASVPDPFTGLYHAPWNADYSVPGPYNLVNSSVVYRGPIRAPGSTLDLTQFGEPSPYVFPDLINTAMPSLDSVVILVVSNYCSNFTGTLSIPYSSAKFDYTPSELAVDKAADPSAPDDSFDIPGSGFVAKPRLLHNSVVSISDGTAWNSYLNTLTPRTLVTFQSTPPVTMDGPDAWVATYDSIVYTNLYNATILYNGQVRTVDLPSATVGLDRVMVVDFTPSDNSQWTGQYPFYYQSPVQIAGTEFTSTLGSLVRIPLLATGEGVSVVEVNRDGSALTTTNIPAGLALMVDNGYWVIAGTPTAEGSFTYYVNASANGDTVFYAIYHLVRKVISSLTLAGDLAPATQGDASWQTYLDILGGQAPYTLGTITGDLPASITVAVQYDSIHLSGSWNDNAVHHFNLALSSADGQSTSSSYAFQATGTALVVTASASLAGTAYTQTAFAGNYTVVGGQAPYTYTVSAGTFPPGLLLNGGTGSVSGAPTVVGSYTWTVSVTSSDGFAGSVQCTLTVAAATFANIIAQDSPIGYWPCNETSGTVLNDASGNGHNGVITAGATYNNPSLRAGSTGCLGATALLNQAAYVTLGASMPSAGTAWAVEAVGEAVGTLNTFWNTLVSLRIGGSSEQGDPGIYATTGTVWGARVSLSGGDLTSTVNPTGTPAHVVLERDGSTANFYVNGTLVMSKVMASWNTLGPTLYILGSGSYPGSYGMVGFVSDVALYNQALGPQRVLARAQFLGFAS